MRIAALVKQVPRFEAMELSPDGRLVRDGLDLEMNPYCRRAVSKGVELAEQSGGTCTVVTLGPPAAEDCLREAIAWGADDGILVSDVALAGSDTLATAKALAAALRVAGPFDLVLVGRNSVDADTGQVGPGLAELLDLPFVTAVKELEISGGVLRVRCEEDDGHSDRTVDLPALVSTAERLCQPCKMPPGERAAVPAEHVRRLTAADLGRGPWGQDGSGTSVGEVRVLESERERLILSGPVEQQVALAVARLLERGALEPIAGDQPVLPVPDRRSPDGPAVAVLAEPDRTPVTRELLGAAAALASGIGGHVVVVTAGADEGHTRLASWGADRWVAVTGAAVEEDVAAAVSAWAGDARPWAILAPSTTWGREIAGRLSARLGAGLTGDAVDLEVSTAVDGRDRRLVAWKPAFGGRLVAAIHATTAIQLVTVRPGVVRAGPPRAGDYPLPVDVVLVAPRHRVRLLDSRRDDDLEELATAARVVGVGAAVPPDRYADLQPLLDVLGAELAATRKVTDRGWQPRARQIGITGRSLAPQLYVAVGLSGKFNHTVGVRSAGTILGINSDPEALLWDAADIGIVGDWQEVVPLLVARLAAASLSSRSIEGA